MDFYINIGRFHSLLVHLPIGMLILGFMLELFSWWKKSKEYQPAIRFTLLLSVCFSLISVITGLILSEEGGYDEALIFLHQWMGITLSTLTVILFLINYLGKGWLVKIYRPLFFIVIGLLSFTGHLGGNLTHGSDYLFTGAETEEVVIEDIATAEVYTSIIAPILDKKCNGCHNTSKSKGDLIMITMADLRKGGKNGSIIDLHDPTESELIKRLHLPINEKKHMPPKGKSQLTNTEIKLLQWWLENKACDDCLVASMTGNEAVQEILDAYNTVAISMPKVDRPDSAYVSRLNRQGFHIYPEASNSPFLIVNLSGNQNLTTDFLEELDELAENIIEINLSGSNLTDETGEILEELVHLRKLHLQNTAIGDRTIDMLNDFEYLEHLNIYGTPITDAAIPSISAIPLLKKLFLWNTSVTLEGVEALLTDKPELMVQYKLDSEIFGDSKIDEPEIVTATDLFADSLLVELKTQTENTKLYYTIDGTEPDSTTTLYMEPFLLHQTANVRVLAMKTGWENSLIQHKYLIKNKCKIQKASLAIPANKKFKANGATSLIDHQKGSVNFQDGKWIGYQGEHLTVLLELDTVREIRQVTVGTLSHQVNWIFFPTAIEVYTSTNGQKFSKAGEMKFPIEKLPGENEIRYISVPINPVQTKYLRVKVLNVLQNPHWHPVSGKPSWLFVDEVLLD